MPHCLFLIAPTGFLGEILFQNVEQALRNLTKHAWNNKQALGLYHFEKQSTGCCHKYPHKMVFSLVAILRTKGSKVPQQRWPTYLCSASAHIHALLLHSTLQVCDHHVCVLMQQKQQQHSF